MTGDRARDQPSFVGLPQNGSGCAYGGPDITGEGCGEPEQVHIAVWGGWGLTGLSSCATHAPIARAAGRVLGEHAYADGCAEGVCWGVELLDLSEETP